MKRQLNILSCLFGVLLLSIGGLLVGCGAIGRDIGATSHSTQVQGQGGYPAPPAPGTIPQPTIQAQATAQAEPQSTSVRQPYPAPQETATAPLPTMLPPPELPALPTPTPLVETTGPLPDGPKIAYSELLADKVVVWAVSAAQPELRHRLTTIDRYGGASIRAHISHDGTKIAYTAMLEQVSGNNRFLAELWVVDLRDASARRLASQVDIGRYQNYPLWSPDDRWIVFDRQQGRDFPYEQSIAMVNVQTGQEQTLATSSIANAQEEMGKWIYPLDWSSDSHSFFYQRGASEHVELWRIDTSQENDAMRVGLISESGIPRCYFLSPDGANLLCTVIRKDPAQNAVVIVPIQAGKSRTLVGAVPTDMSDPIWRPDGKGITINLLAQVGQRAGLQIIDPEDGSMKMIAFAGQGSVVPRSWSPDGQWLAVNQSPETQGDLALISQDGSMIRLISSAGVLDVVGWYVGNGYRDNVRGMYDCDHGLPVVCGRDAADGRAAAGGHSPGH